MDATAMVAGWLAGRAKVEDGALSLRAPAALSTRARARAAYRWIAREVVWTPHDDLVFGEPQVLEGSEVRISLHEEESYASFLLLPLLNLFVGGRLLFVGAPGRGKTTVATLMGLLVGQDLAEVRRGTQRGHPQLSVTDLLGAPLPRDLVDASTMAEVRVAWRPWLRQPVKIVDELNRIPTKTQSALLSLMAEGCVESWDQLLEVGRSAWYFTANDALGGGTFPLIAALRDRMDAVVRCPPFPTHRMADLATATAIAMPEDLRFDEAELERVGDQIRSLPIAPEVHGLLAFLTASLGFCRRASDDVGGMTKDALRVAGRRVAEVCNEDCPLDKTQHLCARTSAGPSVRGVQSALRFAAALAWFRGRDEVGLEELRAVLPWVWFDAVPALPHSTWMSRHPLHRTDAARFISQLVQDAESQYAEYRPLEAELTRMCDGRSPRERIEAQLRSLADEHELCGPIHADILRLMRAWKGAP